MSTEHTGPDIVELIARPDEDRRYLSASRFAHWTEILVAITGLIAAGSLIATIAGHELIPAMEIRVDENDRYVGYVASWPILGILASVFLNLYTAPIAAIAWGMWITRAHANADLLEAGSLRFTPTWAIAGYLVPVINFIQPYPVMQELWKSSDPSEGATRTPLAWKQSPRNMLIGLWWIACLGAALSRTNIVRVPWEHLSSTTAEEAARQGSMASDACLCIAAVCAIVIVRRIAKRQDERARRLGFGLTRAEPARTWPPGEPAR